MTVRVKNARLLLPEGTEEGKYLYYEDGVITAVTAEELPFDEDLYYNELMKRVATSRRKESGKVVFADTKDSYAGTK